MVNCGMLSGVTTMLRKLSRLASDPVVHVTARKPAALLRRKPDNSQSLSTEVLNTLAVMNPALILCVTVLLIAAFSQRETKCVKDQLSDRKELVRCKAVVKRDGVLASVFCRISQFWPVRLVVHGVRTLWWFFGFSSPGKASPSPEEDKSSPSARQWRLGRKRLGRTTRLLLAILPRPLQRALGYPVCTRIGCSVSPEVRCSPTKPCGKGSKRKQDDMDEDEELEQQSWVEALNQELTDEDQSVDPDYEPSAIETDSEEYWSHNDTESDLEVEKGVVVIQDLETIQETPH
ncbi:hypothetical protein QTP86_027212 [Hemibagrus guttatus]|nr:hypothetical protein QTP86_027212 [Hemibagrus guttatus]